MNSACCNLEELADLGSIHIPELLSPIQVELPQQLLAQCLLHGRQCLSISLFSYSVKNSNHEKAWINLFYMEKQT